MTPLLLDPGNRIRRVAVFRALQLGDLLCAVPALRSLRRALPAAEITLIGLPWAAEFARRFPQYIDHFASFPGFPGLPEREPDLAAIPAFVAEMQAQQFDLVIQLHGDGSITNLVTALGNAPRRAGFVPPGTGRPPAHHLHYPAAGSEPRRLLRLMEHLGAPDAGLELEFPVTPADRAALARLAPRLRAPFAILHPGSRDPGRRWQEERFAALGDALAARGLSIVLTGSAGEREVTAAVASAMRAKALDLAGQTDLGTLAALIAGATLVVCNDTGISHLTAAVGTPSVVVFLASDPARWAPANQERHVPVVLAGLRRDGDGSPPPVASVVRAAEALLDREAVYARA